MEEIKQQNNQIDADNNKENLSNDSVTRFEDLSNDIIYEIFDFVDFFQLYKSFFNLNTRFQNLFTNSTFPIQMNDLSASKSTFHHCWREIIMPKQYRVQSIHLSNPFIINHIFASDSIILQFTRLEKLTLHGIDLTSFENLFSHLISLPCLFSLSITKYLISTTFRIPPYRQIFRLPVLKYCKLSVDYYSTSGQLPIAMNEFSPIEHFVLINKHPLKDLNAILSYIPHLKHLSIHVRRSFTRFTVQQLDYSTSLMHLTHVSFNWLYIPFDQLEHMIQHLFNQAQVLRISTPLMRGYLDADRWERLILYHMPHLGIFDIFVSCGPYDYDITAYIFSLNRFTSSFWFERQWFFECYYDIKANGSSFLKFCSVNPYRRKQYRLVGKQNKQAGMNNEKMIWNSVHQLEIYDIQSINNCRKYFPNATELTILCSFPIDHKNLLSTSINHIIPLNHLTKLVVRSEHDVFFRIIEFLQYTPNIHTLEIGVSILASLDLQSIQRSDAFRLVSATNNIRYMKINNQHRLQETKFWVDLCPRLHRLTFNKPNDAFKLFIRFLLLNDHKQLNDLFLLCITDASEHQTDILETFIESENLRVVRSLQLKYVTHEKCIYLWW